MQKTLIALAALATLAGSAGAANVTLYGVADTGLIYQKFDSNEYEDGSTSFSRLSMASGLNANSRFGITGEEDLGEGLVVGFRLENGFTLDDGRMDNDDRLFGREAQLYVKGNLGTVSFGRMGALGSAAGSYDVIFATGDAFDGGDNYISTGFASSARYDNMVTFASPEFAGARVYAQYSLQTNGQENARTSQNDRYAALAATWTADNLALVFGVEHGKPASLNYNSAEDSWTYTLGGNVDFGVTKVFAMGQYASHVQSLADFSMDEVNYKTDIARQTGVDGYALHVGADTPVLGGHLITGLYYADGDMSDPVLY